MANKIFHSSPVTFLDRTDERKLEIYIGSNHPTVQIKNNNTGEYTPDWSITNLQLNANIYLGSQEITNDSQTTINWYTKNGPVETLIATGVSFTVSTNVLDTNSIITYLCRATYQNISTLSQITFTRVNSGINGTNGTSVHIKGTAASAVPVQDTDYYTLAYDGDNMISAELNDAYMYNGDLYICTEFNEDVAYFINVGRIQGPQGADAKTIVLTGSAQVFKVSNNNVYTPSAISVVATSINTSITDWSYSLDGGQTFQGDLPDGVVRNGNEITITGQTLTESSIVIKASDGQYQDVFTIYKAFDGATGREGTDGQPAPVAFLTNENITFSANENGQITATSFTTNVVAYRGTTKTIPTIGEITGLPNGMTVSSPVATDNEQILTFSISNNATLGSSSSNNGTITIPVLNPVTTNLKLSWSKINTGATGAGISSTSVTYGTSSAATITPSSWQSTIPQVAEGEYLWTRTVTDYTDPSITDTVTYSYTKQGKTGSPGRPGSDAVTFQIYSSNGYALSTSVPTVTLQTFAYIGDVAITAGATYKWYVYTSSGWSEITNSSNAYLTVSREDVSFSKSYMCKMTFNNIEYTSVATIDDKNDNNKVFTVKPYNYVAGDLWVVGVDYVPNGFEIGTLLKAGHTNTTYADADWVSATKYDEQIESLQTKVDNYNQYFSFDATDGLRISARDSSGTMSQFSTSLTNTQLSFNYGNEAVAYIDGTKMNIKEAVIESPLSVTGKYSGSTMLQAPVINIGNFSLIVESNGSLSIVVNQ